MIHVNENLYRSPRPKDLNETKTAGIKTIVSLESGLYQLITDTKREHQFPVDFGIDYYDLDCFIVAPPKSWQVEKFLEIVAKGNKTLVHCLSGVDRTGYMCAAYRMQVQGWTYEQAHKEWVALGRHFIYIAWDDDLKAWQKK